MKINYMIIIFYYCEIIIIFKFTVKVILKDLIVYFLKLYIYIIYYNKKLNLF